MIKGIHREMDRQHGDLISLLLFFQNAESRLTIADVSPLQHRTSLKLREAHSYERGRVCSMHGEKSNAFRISMGKPEGKRPV
jgi:hypothetical protein